MCIRDRHSVLHAVGLRVFWLWLCRHANASDGLQFDVVPNGLAVTLLHAVSPVGIDLQAHWLRPVRQTSACDSMQPD
eukprot:9261126-Alexandrium_andersonii.AAC.1